MALVNGTNGLRYASTPPRLDSSPSPWSLLRDVLVVKGSVEMMEGVRSVKKKPLQFARSVWTDKPQSPQGLKTVSLQYQQALKGSGTNFWKHPQGFFLAAPLGVCRTDFTATVTSVSENTGDASKTPKFIKLPCRNIKLELLMTQLTCVLFFCYLWLLWYL